MTSKDCATLKLPSLGEVHLWFAPENTEKLANVGHRTLSLDELKRLNAYKLPKAKTRFLIGHALIRLVISEYLNVLPQKLRFDINPNGRPTLASPFIEGLDFSLSHDGECIALAVSCGATIGLDIADIQRADAALRISEHFFADVEKQEIRNTGDDADITALKFWTVKESIVKVVGASIWNALSDLQLTQVNGRLEMISNPFSGHHDDWKLQLGYYGQKFLVALASLSGEKVAANSVTIYSYVFSETPHKQGSFLPIIQS